MLDEKRGDVSDAEMKGSFGHGVLSRGDWTAFLLIFIVVSLTFCSENEDGEI